MRFLDRALVSAQQPPLGQRGDPVHCAPDPIQRPCPVPLGISASAATMKIIATISGTPSTTVKNATACPGWAACSDLPSR